MPMLSKKNSNSLMGLYLRNLLSSLGKLEGEKEPNLEMRLERE